MRDNNKTQINFKQLVCILPFKKLFEPRRLYMPIETSFHHFGLPWTPLNLLKPP